MTKTLLRAIRQSKRSRWASAPTRTRIRLFSAIVAAAAVLLTPASGSADPSGVVDPAQRSVGRDCPSATDTGGAQSGMGVYVDPTTGRAVVPPSSVPGVTERLSRPSVKADGQAPAVEVPAPGGGTMIDMRGGPLHYMTGVIEPSGRASVGCGTDVRQPE